MNAYPPGFNILAISASAICGSGKCSTTSQYALGRSPKINPALPPAYVADYGVETALAADPEELLDRLDLLLTHGTLLEETRARITEALDVISPATEAGRLARAQLASVMVMTAPEYIVLR